MLRRSLIVIAALVAALVVVPFAAAALVHIRVEGKTQTIFGPTSPRWSPRTPLEALAVAARRGEFYCARHGIVVRQLRRPGRLLRRHRRHRLGLQGQRRLAARRRRPGAAEGRRHVVLWYFATFGATGGPPTLVLTRRRQGLLPRDRPGRPGRGEGAGGRSSSASDARRCRRRPGRICFDEAAHGLVRAIAPGAVRSNRAAVIRAALVAVAAAALLAGCGGGAGYGKATLWVTRDEGRRCCSCARCPPGETAMQALARSRRSRRATAGGSCSRSTASRGLDPATPRLVLLRERDRGRPRRRRVPAPSRRRRVVGLPRLGTRRRSVPVVVGAFPEPFLHGYGGKVRPAVVVGADAAGARALAKLVHGSGRRDGAARARTSCGSSAARTRFTAKTLASGAVELDYSGDAAALARDPALVPLPVRGPVRPTAAAAAPRRARASAALLADRLWSVGVLDARPARRLPAAPGARARPYLWGTLAQRRLRVPALAAAPVDGLARALERADDAGARHARRHDGGAARSRRCNALRLAAVGLAFAAYALLLDHDRLVAAADRAAARCSPSRSRRGSCRRSSATRAGSSRRCAAAASRRRGLRGHAALLSPLVAGSLERGLESRRGDGGARLRPARAHAAPRAAVARARPGRGRRPPSRVVVGALWL